MKECAYCGRENEDSAAACRECGTEEFKHSKIAGGLATKIFPWRTRSNRQEVETPPWPDTLENWLKRNVAYYPRLNLKQKSRLQAVMQVLVAEKNWEGGGELKVSEEMKLAVSAQAALLLLGNDHNFFSRVQSIVIFREDFELPKESWHDERKPGPMVSGVAVDYGTVFLAWNRVLDDGRDPSRGNNLVIHEFAHHLDFLDGRTNGVPVLPDAQRTRRWQNVMRAAFEDLRRDLDAGRTTFLRDNAATNDAEFFSVVSERFFSTPAKLQEHHAEVFDVLLGFYGVDPLEWSLEQTPGIVIEELDFVDFPCPYCAHSVSYPTSEAGHIGECPVCHKPLVVPAPGTTAGGKVHLPILTARLRLRRLGPLDVGALADLLKEHEALPALGLEPMENAAIREWVETDKNVQFPQDDPSAWLVIELLEPALVIGLAFIGLLEDRSQCRFTVLIHPQQRRRGYGCEAIRGLIQFAFDELRLHRVVASCDSRLAAARGLMQKPGMRFEGERLKARRVGKEWVSFCHFAILEEEFQRNSK